MSEILDTDKSKDPYKELPKILGMLRQSVSGHLSAYKDLLTQTRPKRMEKLYSEFSENEWNKVFEANPDDWIACHHLAICYHARAFDLEADKKTDQALTNWKLAHKFWHKLFHLRQPIQNIKPHIKNLESFNKEKHQSKLKELEKRMGWDFLLIHQGLYELYTGMNEKTLADNHYLILEKSPFKEKTLVLNRIYEKEFGDTINQLIKELKQKHQKNASPKTMIKYGTRIFELNQRIRETYSNRKPPSAYFKDRIRLESWELLIDFLGWQERFNEMAKSHKGAIKKLEKLKQSYENAISSTEQTQLIDEHDEIVNHINKDREEIFSQISEVEQHMTICQNLLTELNLFRQTSDIHLSILDYQNILSDIKDGYLPKKETVEIIALYNFIETIERSQSLANSYQMQFSEPEEDTLSAPGDTSEKRLWHWKTLSKDDNPYKKTCFVLFNEEMPLIDEYFDINREVKKLLKKRRKLEKKARASQHIVFGNQIKREELNNAELRVKNPVDLAKDMILQHQAHKVNVDDIVTLLEDIEIPDHESVSLKLSPTIFKQLKPSPKDIFVQKKWIKPERKMQDFSALGIKWPI